MKKRLVFWMLAMHGGCQTDPELQQARRSLRAWETAAKSDAPDVRDRALAEALSADPGSLALRRSMARQLADSGAYEDAIQVLSGVIPERPTRVHRYVLWDRAAIHATAGMLPQAAADVQLCIQLGVDRRSLAQDSAFHVLQADSTYAHLLPKPSIVLHEDPPSDKVLLGESWRRNVRVQSPGQDIRIEAVGPLPDALVLAEVVEDRIEFDDFHSKRDLRLEWRAASVGTLHLPSLQIHSSGLSASLAPANVEVVALSGPPAAPVANRPAGFPIPSRFDATAGSPGERISSLGGYIVQAPAHWECTLTPVPPGSVRLVRREGGQPRWNGWWVPEGAGAAWSCPSEGVNLRLQ